MERIDCLTPECVKLLIKHNLLKPLIKSELKDKIINDIVLDKDIEEKQIKKFLQPFGIVSDDGIIDKGKYEKWLISQKISKSDFEKIALNETKLKRHNQQKFGHKVEARFLERKNNLDIFVYSLIRIKDFYQAKELYMRLLCKEEEFGDLAKRHSEGIESKTRGVVGPISLEATHPALASTLRKATPGEIQAPIKLTSANGNIFLIVRLESIEPAKLDELMNDKIALELFDDWLESETNILMESIIKNHCGDNSE